MSNPTAYDLVVLENERLAKQLEAAQADARYLDAKVDFSAKECITKDNTIKCIMMERDSALRCAKDLENDCIKRGQTIDRLRFELDEARSERDDLAAKLDKLRSNRRNKSSYSEDQISRFFDAYESLMQSVHEVWCEAPSIDQILNGDDSSDGDSE